MLPSDKQRIKLLMENQLPSTIKKRKLLDWFLSLNINLTGEVSINDVIAAAKECGITVEKDTKAEMTIWAINTCKDYKGNDEQVEIKDLDKEYLKKKYIEEDVSIVSLADEAGVTFNRLDTLFRRWGFQKLKMDLRKQGITERNEKIIEMVNSGMSRREVAKALNVHYITVKRVMFDYSKEEIA